MADIKKVIKGIECCICQGKTHGPCSPECPYEVIEPDCWIVMNEDVLELLKEQQPMKPVYDCPLIKCPKCKNSIDGLQKYCDECGQAIDWTKDGEQE